MEDKCQPLRRRILGWPGTRLGWWSVGLGATFAVLFIINSTMFMPSAVEAPWRQVVLPLYGIAMMLCGLARRGRRPDRGDTAARALVAGMAYPTARAVCSRLRPRRVPGAALVWLDFVQRNHPQFGHALEGSVIGEESITTGD